MSTPKRKRYDFVRALWSEHKTLAYRKRILRKLVREAVWNAYCQELGCQYCDDETPQKAADRIAKELVP